MKCWTAVVLAAGLMAAPAAFAAEKDKKDDPKHVRRASPITGRWPRRISTLPDAWSRASRRRIVMTSLPGTAKGWVSASIAG